ncbi:MAG: dihydrolipoyl dehydrogenase, partial [Gammaproteobacteria bacterium]|nr:dihydrolipoyl dehydrogenase [Gammaproteobacteria bacterium]
CLNVGCIPSKAIIHAADEMMRARELAARPSMGIQLDPPRLELAQTMAWKDGIVGTLGKGVKALLERAGARVMHGHARLLDGKRCEVRPLADNGPDDDAEPIRVHCEHLLLATGSRSVPLAELPFSETVLSSTELLALTELPQKLVVVGAGYIGLELACAFAKLGSEVTVVEAAERPLTQYDTEHARVVGAGLRALGIELLCNARVQGTGPGQQRDQALQVELADQSSMTLDFDRVLVAVGRRPASDDLGLDELALDHDGPFVRVDEVCRTSMRNVYAIGDLTGEPMLAHRAMAQGEVVAAHVAGQPASFDKVCIPAVCFTDPEVVSAGWSPERLAASADAARIAPHGVKTARFPFKANGRALTMARGSGFVEVLARADNHLLLGLSAVGTGVSELAGGFALALEMGACLEDLAHTVHAHPTLGEAVQEAALKALGQPLHG